MVNLVAGNCVPHMDLGWWLALAISVFQDRGGGYSCRYTWSGLDFVLLLLLITLGVGAGPLLLDIPLSVYLSVLYPC